MLLAFSFVAFSESQILNGSGMSKFGTCDDLVNKVRDICSAQNSATNITSNNVELCMSSCKQNDVNIDCSLNYSCDSARKPEILSIKIKETGVHTFTSDKDSVCRSAKRKASKKVKTKCLEFANETSLDDLITDKNYSSCRCKPMTSRLFPNEEAYQCEIDKSVTCNKKER